MLGATWQLHEWRLRMIGEHEQKDSLLQVFSCHFKALRTLLSVVKMFVLTLHNNSGELLGSHVFFTSFMCIAK